MLVLENSVTVVFVASVLRLIYRFVVPKMIKVAKGEVYFVSSIVAEEEE